MMTTPVITASPEEDLHTVAERMLEHQIGCLPVVDEANHLAGILTDGDFVAREVGIPFSTFRRPQVLGRWLGREGVERIYEAARERPVKDVMTTPVHTLDEEDSLADLLDVMLRHDIKHVPIVREDEVVGIVARHDLLKLLMGEIESDAGERQRGE